MSIKVDQNELLLDSLMEDPNVKAAVLVDDRGYIVEKRGSAAALKSLADDAETIDVTGSGDEKGPSENLYLVQAGDDYLIVVFDNHINFERIKSSVDTTLDEFDMKPATE